VLNNGSVLECVCVASDEEWNGLGGSEVAFGERSQDNNGAFVQSDPESERDSNGTFSRFENEVSGNTSGDVFDFDWTQGLPIHTNPRAE
jgi:hypothetical protein